MDELIQNAETTEVAVQEEKAVEVKQPEEKTPLQLLAETKLAELQELNPGIVLDFLRVWTRVKINKKGQFYYILGDEEFLLGESIDIQIKVGEPVYQLWGKKDTPEDGELICLSKDKIQDSEGNYCANCPNYDDCKIRFMLIMQILEDIDGSGIDEELYLMGLPPTSAYAIGDYFKLLAKKYKKGAKDVVTRIYTKEEPVKDSKDTYIAIKFGYSQNQEKINYKETEKKND